MLTKIQQELLFAYPSTLVSDTIIDPDHGISRIKAGQCGGTRSGTIQAFNTTSKGLVAGWFGEEPQAVVTFTQLRQWANTVPADLRERIRVVRAAEQAENLRVYKWCHCHHGDPERAARCEKSNEGDPLWGGRYHPTDEEDKEHLVTVFDLRDQEKELLQEALGLGDEPVGQLDLFDQLMGENG